MTDDASPLWVVNDDCRRGACGVIRGGLTVRERGEKGARGTDLAHVNLSPVGRRKALIRG